ncbi:glycoside hydrolase family 1 protein [Listeria ivanovii]|uniref:glycoside hydrolase family 1 protein n=1 Tax=Listeria ivanovii TaxID=1638 RepID=UPI002816080C|nr:family 1 glycosylhydrolase [Listeria ivanovii]
MKTTPFFQQISCGGASSAAWQVEGAVNEDGRTPAIIDLNSKTKKPFADNSVASDHYHHYLEDVALMKEAGFTSYRFSIAWPRIYPTDSFEPNQLGIDFYDHLIDELVKNGIEPIVTLYHYDMPVWVDEKYDGWYGRGIIDAFDQYTRTCFKEFGDRVKYWLSINEQNMQPGLAALPTFIPTDGSGFSSNFWYAVLTILIAISTSVVMTLFLGKRNTKQPKSHVTIKSPLSGKIIR